MLRSARLARHALQQRMEELPEDARQGLAQLAAVVEEGDDAMAELPPAVGR